MKVEYKITPLPQLHLDSNKVVERVYDNEIKERIIKIVNFEGPIIYSLLSKRLLNSIGISKLGKNLKDVFDEILENLQFHQTIQDEGIVFWPQNSRTYKDFRVSKDRYSYQIPIQEALNGIIFEFTTNSITYNEAQGLLCKAFNYLKKGTSIFSISKQAIDLGVKENILKKLNNNRIVINE